MAQVTNFFGILQGTGDLDDSRLIRIDAEKVRCDRETVTEFKAPRALCRVRIRGEGIGGKVRSWDVLALGSFKWGRLMGCGILQWR